MSIRAKFVLPLLVLAVLLGCVGFLVSRAQLSELENAFVEIIVQDASGEERRLSFA